MKISFQIDYRTHWGQRLFISGSIPELGNWDTNQAQAMTFLSGGMWKLVLEVQQLPASGFQYNYFVKEESSQHIEWEKGNRRNFRPAPLPKQHLIALDSWRVLSQEEAALYTSAFTNALMRPSISAPPIASTTVKKAGKTAKKNQPTSGQANYRFQIEVPRIDTGYQLCLIGSDPALGNWDEQNALVMDGSHYPLWQADVALTNKEVIRYKYGVYDTQTRKIKTWEKGEDRILWLNPASATEMTYIQTDEQFRFPQRHWKGTGVAIPVFSLRTHQGTGVGEFLDIKPLVDWSTKTGLKLIQILPINDTVATHTWLDSYPYAAISVFALHPIYLNLEAMGTLKGKKDQKFYRDQRELLNKKDFVDYEAVMKVKSRYFKQLYDQDRDTFLADPAFQQFFSNNRHWLVPYAVFSRLRDQYGTCEFSQWGEYAHITPAQLEILAAPNSPTYDDVAVHYFIQYHLSKQLVEATNYARQHGVVLKGDIPIGIYRNSVDAWLSPELFHMDRQAGAPPDDFSATGQNWRFPTYNWERMALDGYAWWQERLRKMADYFDAYRIDHILGFFRIWEMPAEGVDGLLGHFSPALPYYEHELAERGIWFDYSRYCTPYIRAHMLWDLFGEYRDEVVKEYLLEYQPGHFRLKTHVSTQQQVEALLAPTPEATPEQIAKNARMKEGLFQLIGEVLFLEAAPTNGKGHAVQRDAAQRDAVQRDAVQAFNLRIAFQNTYSYRELDDWLKQKLHDLYIDYFYKRHEQFWREQGLIKLPVIKNATNMLVCGEDLGMVPDVVPGVMQELGLLSLGIQRMPKETVEFGNPLIAPYLSVVSTSSHDMSTLRGWWEEDSHKTQRYYNHVLGQHGEAPAICEPWIIKDIIVQHLQSPAMWAIFPIQDLLAMDSQLQRADTQAERINVPANPQNFWKYRLHLNLEDLLKATDFNTMLQELNTNTNRN
ncbi:MAG: 4-alpha-glucanotransferase [Bacteroidota bacterium]